MTERGRMGEHMKFKLTKEEKNWVLYDVGNSAFTLLIATIMPIYFNYLAENAGLSSVSYLAYWGYAASAATLVVAILGPICGSLADTKGFKKIIFIVSLAVGAIGCVSLGFAKHWLVFLVIYVIAKAGYSGSLIFYDSMLSDVTTQERMDDVSSQGYAWGYIGSCIPFVVSLVVVLGAGKFGLSMEMAMGIAFVIVAVWWVALTIPLLKTYHQKHYVERQKYAVRQSFVRLGRTFKNIRKEKRHFYSYLHFSSILMVYTQSLIWRRRMVPHSDWTARGFCWHFWQRRLLHFRLLLYLADLPENTKQRP